MKNRLDYEPWEYHMRGTEIDTSAQRIILTYKSSKTEKKNLRRITPFFVFSSN